ncbi:hypothetical protein ACFL9T_10110 [Thermodesulfobacteriota bacterium]
MDASMVSQLKGKELYHRITQRIPEIDGYLSKVISYAYKNPILISNPVLSRNPFSSSLLLKAARGLPSKKLRFLLVILLCNLVKYYLKSLAFLGLYLLHFMTFKISKLRFRKHEIDKDKPVIILNTFIMIDRVYPKKKFEDTFFGELYEVLRSNEKQYVILCILFGDKPWNLKRRIDTYNIIADDGRNFVTEFDLMRVWDWICMLGFIFSYPFLCFGLLAKEFGKFDMLLKEEIVETLDSVNLPEYVRYLAGRRISLLTDMRIKVISWWENQAIDKMLFRGILDNIDDVELFGCQFFAKPFQWRNIYPLDEEKKLGVLPNVILVSGKYYLNENSALNFKLGFSPRYSYLFNIRLNDASDSKRSGLLLLLPYSIDDSRRIIKMVEIYQTEKYIPLITIKLHPNHLMTAPFKIPENWKYTEENLETLCPRASIVVTSESSAALEAAVMGCSIIIVGADDGLTFNPMPEYGKSKIWDLVFDIKEFQQAVERLSEYRHENPGEIVSMAELLRDMFFTKSTKKKYIKIFDL